MSELPVRLRRDWRIVTMAGIRDVKSAKWGCMQESMAASESICGHLELAGISRCVQALLNPRAGARWPLFSKTACGFEACMVARDLIVTRNCSASKPCLFAQILPARWNPSVARGPPVTARTPVHSHREFTQLPCPRGDFVSRARSQSSGEFLRANSCPVSGSEGGAVPASQISPELPSNSSGADAHPRRPPGQFRLDCARIGRIAIDQLMIYN
jgi:hypothetical protein